MEQRNDFFDTDQDEETLYNSLLQYLWYIKLKNTCPITGAQLSKGFVADILQQILSSKILTVIRYEILKVSYDLDFIILIEKYQQFLVPQSENFLSRFKTLEVSGLLQLVYLGEISIDKTSESELRKMIGPMDSVFEFLPIFSPNYKIFGKFFCQSWSSVDQRKVVIKIFFQKMRAIPI